MNIALYLFFKGCCDEAIEFYRDCLDAEVLFLMRYKEGPTHLIPTGAEEQVFHATVKFGETVLNMSDLPAEEASDFAGFALLTHIESVERAEVAFDALSQGGHIKMPLDEVPWARIYGIVVDRFGVTWKIQVNR